MGVVTPSVRNGSNLARGGLKQLEGFCPEYLLVILKVPAACVLRHTEAQC
jgi:hypothetical protein